VRSVFNTVRPKMKSNSSHSTCTLFTVLCLKLCLVALSVVKVIYNKEKTPQALGWADVSRTSAISVLPPAASPNSHERLGITGSS